MLKTRWVVYKPMVQCRSASVLSSSTFSSNAPSRHSDSSLIVTLPIASASNHPAQIPQEKVRLTLDELQEVLASSKELLKHLQQEHVDLTSSRDLQHRLERLCQEQMKLFGKKKA